MSFNDLDILSPAVTGDLHETPSAFDNFWGVVTGFESRVGQDETSAEKRFFRQLVMTIRLDTPIGDTVDMWESYNLPTDPKTGEPLIDPKTGRPARPNASSKWGVQETQLNTSLGVPWEGMAQNLIGLHARFERKGTRMTAADIAAKKRAPRGEPPYGRYIVEWDHYDNDVRRAAGLAAITTTFSQVQAGAEKPAAPEVKAVNEGEARMFIAKGAIGKNFLEQYAEVRANMPELAKFATRDAINQLVADGVLVEEDTGGKVVYKAGPSYTG